MAKNFIQNFTLQGARIGFRNFRGAATKFTPEGKRTFAVFLKDVPDLVSKLQQDGWNIKFLKPQEEGDDPTPFITCIVKYGKVAPNIRLITGNSMTLLDEAGVGTLDYADIENVDITIRPFQWEMAGRSGVTAYVKDMYVTIRQDELEKKYAALMMSSEDENDVNEPWN